MINENWIKNENLKEYKKQAVAVLEKVKKQESENTYYPVRIDKKTVVLKKIK